MKDCCRTIASVLVGLAGTFAVSVARSADAQYTFAAFAGSTNSGSADGTGEAAQFKGPYAVAVDRDGNVYVADTLNNTIRKATPGGVVTTLVGPATQFGGFPDGVAVDGAGTVFVANTYSQSILKVTPTGVVTTIAGSLGPAGSADGPGSAARFNYPYGIAVDGSGNLYVSDTFNNTIRKLVPTPTEWMVTTVAGTAGTFGSTDGAGSDVRFSYPQGVAVDSTGNLYIADSSNNTIRKMTPAGVVTTFAGQVSALGGFEDGMGTAAKFRTPVGVAVDGAGNVYVADQYNHAIRKITPAGMVTTIGGDPSITNASGRPVGGYANGTGTGARFNLPSGVAVDAAGNLYVADQMNNLIRKGTTVSLPPEIVFSNPGFATGSGRFGVELNGPPGQVVIVDGSTDLVNWLPVGTNTFSGPFSFIEPPGGNYTTRFYRARTP